MSLSKMYIAVLDEAPDYMVPTLVAHSVINGHIYLSDWYEYDDWLANSFRKVVVRVNRKEYSKIKEATNCWEGHENTICNAEGSCLVVMPMKVDDVPNVLKFAKLWAPKQ